MVAKLGRGRVALSVSQAVSRAYVVRTHCSHDGVKAYDSHYRQLVGSSDRWSEPLALWLGLAEKGLMSADLAQRQMLTIPEAARRLSVGRSMVYAMLRSGELGSVTIGRLRRIPIDSLESLLVSLNVAPIGAAETE